MLHLYIHQTGPAQSSGGSASSGRGNYDFLGPRRRKDEDDEDEVESVIEALAVVDPPAPIKQLKAALKDRSLEYKAEYGRALKQLIADREQQIDNDVMFLLLH